MIFRKKKKNNQAELVSDPEFASDLQPEIDSSCRNCGYEVSGAYCSNCGQKFEDVNKPMKEILSDLVGIFNLDASIFNTIKPFLFKPGYLSLEFLNGKRKRYLSPLRLYLFLSIVFFFVMRIYFNSDNATGVVYQSSSDSTAANVLADSTALEYLRNDSLFYGDIDSSNFDSTNIALDSMIRKSAVDIAENEAIFLSDLLNFSSYGLFILMPVFALLLQLLYIRRKHYYVEHLIFSVNMHSFALLILTIFVSLQLVFSSISNYTGILLFVIPVYFVAGMKRFYQQNIFKILGKTLVLTILYSILLLLALIGIAILAAIRL
ncbi:DUF3667 domain-containing protein [Bacteroidota bacterium]